MLFFFIHSAAHSGVNPASVFSQTLSVMLLGDTLLGDEHFSVTIAEPQMLFIQKGFLVACSNTSLLIFTLFLYDVLLNMKIFIIAPHTGLPTLTFF